MSDLNVSVLQKPLMLKEALYELRAYGPAWKIGLSVLLLVTFAPLIVFVVFASSVIQDGGAIYFLIMLASGGLYGLYDLYKELNENALVRRVATYSGMSFRRDFYPSGDYTGFPFMQQMFIPRAMRSNEPLFMEIGHLRPQNSQRRSQSAVTYTYLRIKLPKQLPHIILRRNSSSSLLALAPEGEKLQLEGEFGDRFTLYAPEGYARDALYIFTPDVMERFLDATSDFDCEIIGDEMYFYTLKKISLTKPANLVKLVAIVRHVLQKFHSQSGKYRDERINNLVTPDGTRVDRMKLRPSLISQVVFGAFMGLLVLGLYLRYAAL